MRSRPQTVRTCCLRGALGLAVAACGGDEGASVVHFSADAGTPAPIMDASTLGLDATLDSNVAIDSSSAADRLSGAECAGDLEQLHAARSEGRSFATALSGNRFYVAYLIPTCGGSTG